MSDNSLYSLNFTNVKLGQTSPNGWAMGGNTTLTNSFEAPFGLTSSQQQLATDMKTYGPIIAGIGAIGQMASAYYAAKAAQYQLDSKALTLEFQKDIAGINARQAEFTAQQTLRAGQQQSGALTLKYGKAKGSQRAAMAANGGVIGEGSNAEIEATNDLMKEIDANTINANTVRQAENARTQSQNYKTQAAMYGVGAENARMSSSTISPMLAAGTSFLTSATSIASTMYRDKQLDKLLARVQ